MFEKMVRTPVSRARHCRRPCPRLPPPPPCQPAFLRLPKHFPAPPGHHRHATHRATLSSHWSMEHQTDTSVGTHHPLLCPPKPLCGTFGAAPLGHHLPNPINVATGLRVCYDWRGGGGVRVHGLGLPPLWRPWYRRQMERWPKWPRNSGAKVETAGSWGIWGLGTSAQMHNDRWVRHEPQSRQEGHCQPKTEHKMESHRFGACFRRFFVWFRSLPLVFKGCATAAQPHPHHRVFTFGHTTASAQHIRSREATSGSNCRCPARPAAPSRRWDRSSA